MSLHYESAVDIAEGVRNGEYDPVDVVEEFIDRIEERNEVTNSFVTVLGDEARERAREVREQVENGEGEDLPLAGVPLAMKDLSESKAGVRNTKGLKPLSDNVADSTTPTIQRLEAAGAVIVGTTNTPELGHRVRTDNLLQGPTGTPFDPEYNAGGSSGGSAAALADGLAALATGSDVGGSLRNPASCCGVVSVKPSHGLVPRGNRTNGFRGHTPVGVLGPMARDVESLAVMLDVEAGKHPSDPFSVPKQDGYAEAVADAPAPSDLDIAYSPDLDIFAVAPEVREALESTLADLEREGATVDRVDLDTPPKGELTHVYSLTVTTFFATSVAEVDESLDMDLLEDYADGVPTELQSLVGMGRSNEAMDVAKADFPRTDLFHAIDRVFDDYDALACPTLATPPLTHDEPMPTEIDGESTTGMPTDWTMAWPLNLTGHPVVNVPADPVDGLPIGMQLVGETYSEAELLGIAAALEEASPWDYPS
ncbi:amidase [Natronomonas sp.]|uniref:amidase n=1 Tax=Natronomonas sp. TaxID=2184060 RepID=UPI002FC327FC